MNFRKLVNDKSIVKTHPKRVKGAMKVYHDYWKLLSETSLKLTKLMARVDRVIKSINNYQKNDKSVPFIEDCIKSLNKWLAEASKIEELEKKWNQLAEEASAEEVEWRKIEAKSKRKWETIVTGIFAFGAVALVCGLLCGFAGPIGVIAIGAASITWLEVTSVIAAGAIGLSLLHIRRAYKDYKQAREARAACKQVKEKIDYVSNKLKDISQDSQKIAAVLADLKESYEQLKELTNDMEEAKQEIADMSKAQTEGSSNSSDCYVKQKFEDIDEALLLIMESMYKFNGECKKCCETIKESRSNILEKFDK